MKRMICILLLGVLLLSMTSCQTAREEVLPAMLEVVYTFAEDDAGFAQGDITITPTESTVTSGYYLVYWADEKGPLAGYDELASVPITGESVTVTVGDRTWFPPQATRLVVFESDQRFLDEAPAAEDAAAVIRLPAEKRLKLTDATLSFGAVSDVHMNYQPYERGAYEKWEAALNFFADKQMDYVFVAGDMTGDEFEEPLTSQYTTYLDIIARSRFDGTKIFEAIGNHGNTTVGRELFVRYTAGKAQQHPIEGSAYYSVELDNNLFIVMAQELEEPGASATRDNFSREQIDWVEALLQEHGNTGKNIFLIEHAPFYDFGPGDRDNGAYTSTIQLKRYFPQTMRLHKLLKQYPDVVMLSGHTHLSLYDGENYSDEDGMYCRMIHLGSLCQPCSYGTGNTLERSTDGRYPVTETYGSEAYTVQVYEEYILFTGYNLSTDKIIPHACFMLPTKG